MCGRYYIAEDDLSDELSRMIDELNRKDHPRVPPAVQIRHPHRRPHLAGRSSRRARAADRLLPTRLHSIEVG